MKYILSDKSDYDTGCLFCSKARQTNDRENLILYRGPRTFIIMNLYPYNNGHLMVVPYQHCRNVDELDEATLGELMVEVKYCVRALRKAMSPDGFNLGINIGRPAGAGVENHVHMHVVPRWQGDSNFMPVLDETRLIPEDLAATYDRLVAAGIAER